MNLLEKVQKGATQLMIKDRNLSYSERLNRLNITTLETRRLRGDLIQVSTQSSDFEDLACVMSSLFA